MSAGDIYAAVGVDDVVSGEAVALDLPAANVAIRVVSGVIDLACQGVLLFLILIVGLISTSASDEALLGTAVVVGMFTVLVLLPATIETLSRGRSLGKLVCGLRTVRDDAGPITFRHAFVRALVGVVELWALTGVPALVCAMLSEKGKRLGDYVAGTYVLRDRVPFTPPQPVPMPPRLAAWATQADLAALPGGLALAVRQFLDRAPTLTPASRLHLGLDLASRVAPHIAPTPPPGTHPEEFLAAVLAERHRRDSIRLQGQAELRRRFGVVG